MADGSIRKTRMMTTVQPDLIELLDERAESLGISRNAVVNRALREYVEREIEIIDRWQKPGEQSWDATRRRPYKTR